MIPSSKWFPSSLAARAAWMQNFATQFSFYGVALGFAAPQITAVNEDNEDFQSIAATMVTVDTFKAAIIDYRISLTEGSIGDAHPVFPMEDFSGPPNDRPAGMFERIDKLRTQILAASAYTPEIGAALDILTQPAASLDASEMKPVIKASASFSNYKFTVDVTRLGQPGFKVQIQRKDSSAWENAAFATTNPCEVTVTPTSPGDPERILVRAFLIKNNEEVGEPSDPTFVTINP